MVYGWFAASVAGIALGAMIGSSKWMRSYVAPSLELLRPLPVSAIIPVAIAFFGLSQGMALFVIAFGAIWPMLLATIHGFAAVEPRLYEVARSLHMSRLAVIFKIALPSASPDILSGMRLSLTVALILSVVCEILAGLDGLGHWILLSARSFRSADLFAGVILLGFSVISRRSRCRPPSSACSDGARPATERGRPQSHEHQAWTLNSFAAVRPRTSAFSSSLSDVQAKMWSTGCSCQGNG